MDDMYQYAASAVNNNSNTNSNQSRVEEEDDVILKAFNNMGWGKKWTTLVDTVKKSVKNNKNNSCCFFLYIYICWYRVRLLLKAPRKIYKKLHILLRMRLKKSRLLIEQWQTMNLLHWMLFVKIWQR